MKNFNYLGKINIDNIKNKLKKFSKKDWNEFDFRQKTYEVHKETKTIPIIFDTDFRIKDPTKLTTYAIFKKELEEINNKFKVLFGKGFIIRAILVNLKANTKIPFHIDKGKSLEMCNRVHIPIITNKDVFFKIEDQIKQLKEGEMWEINNSERLHSVENNSNKDRIHLIIDWIND
jgi:uncharacterized protein YajQ (UPF0234 family)